MVETKKKSKKSTDEGGSKKKVSKQMWNVLNVWKW